MRRPLCIDRAALSPWLASLLIASLTIPGPGLAWAASPPASSSPTATPPWLWDGDALVQEDDDAPSPNKLRDPTGMRPMPLPGGPGGPLNLPGRPPLGGKSPALAARGDENKPDQEDNGDDNPSQSGKASASSSASKSSSGDKNVTGGNKDWSTQESQNRPNAHTPPPKSAKVNIDFVDTDIKDVVKYFSELTQRNFIIGKSLSGKITIMSPEPVTVVEAYEAFLSALDAAGYTTVTEGKLTRIVETSGAVREPLRFYKGEFVPDTANFVTRLLKLDNVAAADISQVINPMLGAGAALTPYAPTNTLIITDSANNIRRITELVKELDVSAPRAKLEVIKITFATASDILEKVNAIFAVDGAASGGATGRAGAQTNPRTLPNRRRPGDRAQAGGETAAAGPSVSEAVGGDEVYISKTIADERTNSIIVLATDKAIADIKALIAKLDTEVGARSNIHVVYLKHAKAEELATVLSNLTTQSTSSTTGTQNGRRTPQTGTGRAAAGATGLGRNAAATAQDAATAAGGGISATFESGVKVTADAATNSLVITASDDDYKSLYAVIQKLDRRRKQVFVETVIMEINDSSSTNSGVKFHLGAPAGDDAAVVGGFGGSATSTIGLLTALADPTSLASALTGAAIGIIGNAINTGLTDASGNAITIPAFGVVLNALQHDGSTNVLSSPDLLTIDNEEAEIVVGETVPFSTGGTLTQTGLPSFNVTREDVALTMRLTPQISEGNEVRLEVYQEISRLGDSISVGNGLTVPKTTKRSAKTTVSASDNQTIVLGGLMETNDTVSEDKIPVLGDIPLIGALFRSKVKTKQKTNLLIFLTPHIIDSPEDLSQVYRVKMLQREEFLKRFYGKSALEQGKEMDSLLRYSMNLSDQPKAYQDKADPPPEEEVMITPQGERPVPAAMEGEEASPETSPEDDAQAPPGDDTPSPAGGEEVPSP